MTAWGRAARIAADAGLGAVFVAALVFEAVRIAVSWGGNYWQFGIAAGTVVCGIALLRRQDTVRAAAAGLAVAAVAVLVSGFAQLPSQPGLAMVLALFVLVAAAVRTSRPLPASAVAAAGLAVAAGSLFTAHTPVSPSAVVVLNGVGWSAAVSIGLFRRLRHARRQAVIEKVRQDERLELARELHDVVAHHISGVVLQTQAAKIVHRKHPEQLDDSLTDIENASSDALAAMRQVVGLLRDTEDSAPGLPEPEQLAELVDRFSRLGPRATLRLPESELVWPPEIRSTIYRVVQESLTNVCRHAPHARAVTVSVRQDPESVFVEVVDDAPPGSALRRGGYGLIGLRERVEALSGTFSAGPRTGGGWSVRATLPVLVGKR
ncbi:sensor histidine kinase [Amycolatopsis sp. YIM 10]|uniref:sensor histidine kinase n=1 Tax=Amycolatopsis sp. YIM 10 TaxID=2653857 RepID=UPI0012A839DB|nr:sensor histidine kinase [Amycolatopsis sp. YIM 10]QFU86823.1 Sensor histidine kinase DesK [Amycolatopsis sp. YIM 10]